jgi:hypothetical protein
MGSKTIYRLNRSAGRRILKVFKNAVNTLRAGLTDPYLQGAVAFLLLGRAILGVAEHMKEVAQQSQGIYETVAEQMAQSAASVSTVAAATKVATAAKPPSPDLPQEAPDPDLGPGVYERWEKKDSAG